MHHPEEEEEYDYDSLGTNTTMLQNAFAGALAGIAEHCAMYPVDSIKTRMQVINVQHQINTTKTVKLFNLWKGVNSVVLGAGPAHALHFGTYEFCKEVFAGANKGEGHHPLANASAGACATLAHDTVMNPFDVVKQRMQLRESTYKSIRECARDVYRKEGLVAFYISLPATLFMSLPFQTIQFTTYEFFRKLLNNDTNDHRYDPKTHIVAGGLAGAIASSITTPLDVIKTLLQTRGTHSDQRIQNCKGIKEAAIIIYERYGFHGFFRGFKPRILTHMPSTAISWTVYEYIKWVINLKQKEDFISF
ncbi:mitochondrial carrier protein [Cokeromyces recurvatus]|uniref:mitochondrial carrier protein n=1 Tax=Cokeromyces recurvatus TaxID=90255 RepID=UPI00221F7F2D|nr:mitochondrial carrier protein [Cokeromyces recurvatus]KAI7898211.1 mitochondrial carrier protein [Cokeromyces recurvatus]